MNRKKKSLWETAQNILEEQQLWEQTLTQIYTHLITVSCAKNAKPEEAPVVI